MLTTDVVDAADVVHVVQRVEQMDGLLCLDIIVEHKCDGQVLLDAVGHNTGCEREQHNESHEDEQQADADCTDDGLHPPCYLAFPSLLMSLTSYFHPFIISFFHSFIFSFP